MAKPYRTGWDADATTDSRVFEFEVSVPDPAYRTPLEPGHKFYHGAHALPWVPTGKELIAASRAEAERLLDVALVDVGAWWVVTLDAPVDIDDTWESIGDHIEGFSHQQWSIVLALNDIPEDAGGEFRLVSERNGDVVGDLYPHRRGRGVLFRSQHWHGIAPLLKTADRVSIAQVVEPA